MIAQVLESVIIKQATASAVITEKEMTVPNQSALVTTSFVLIAMTKDALNATKDSVFTTRPSGARSANRVIALIHDVGTAMQRCALRVWICCCFLSDNLEGDHRIHRYLLMSLRGS